MARSEAIGLIETFGIVYAIEAVLTEGDVGACRTAVAAGCKAVQEIGSEVYSSVVIARPHEDLAKITALYSLDKLLPYVEK